MSIPIITRDEAQSYAKDKGISLMEAKEQLEETALRIRFSKDVKPIFDQEGFFLRTEARD